MGRIGPVEVAFAILGVACIIGLVKRSPASDADSVAAGIGVVLIAGLEDGVNPCAFATIIFLLSYLQVARRRPREILQVGAAFIAGVFLAYFAMGLGLIEAVAQLQKVLHLEWLRRVVNWSLAGFSLVIMVLSVRDGILCLRGRLQDIALQLPGVLKESIHGVIRRGSRQAHFVIAAFVIGVVISVLELACTGQVYLPTIAYMLQKGQNTHGAIGYLFMYNIMFIAPLVAIFILARFGLTSDALTRFLQKHAAVVKFATALLFLLLFLFFLFGSLLPPAHGSAEP
jgi:cytochrome c biogenesis protein CcdA